MKNKIVLGKSVSIDHLSLVDRFWKKVKKTSGCWLWVAANNSNGYGIFRGGIGHDKYGSKKWILAHRFSYQLTNGKIKSGLEIDHLCRNRLCVNPSHMEVVTHRTNTLRGESPPAQQAKRDRCIRGHIFDKLELSGKRRCSVCDRIGEESL